MHKVIDRNANLRGAVTQLQRAQRHMDWATEYGTPSDRRQAIRDYDDCLKVYRLAKQQLVEDRWRLR